MKGRIHSIETSGMVDGPGIRFVIFTQGCLLRCKFCHNPDTWDLQKGREVEVEEIMNEIMDYIPYLQKSGGGITVSGGEPLLQIDFLTELFTRCKEVGIHTTIDTSGGCYHDSPAFVNKLDKLLKVTDLILLDIKQIHNQKHKELTGMTNQHILKFAQYLSEKNVPVWIRHVLVPGYTDNPEDLQRLSGFIRTLSNVRKIEVLPYHKLGVYKWKTLNITYPLEGVESPTKESVERAESILGSALVNK